MATEYNDHVEINSDNAILLLAAAEELGENPEVVETTSNGYFRVPQNVVDRAGLGAAHKQSSKTPSEKQAESVREPRVWGDPTEGVNREPASNLSDLIPQQDNEQEQENAKAAAKRAAAEEKAAITEARKQAPAQRTAKKATAKKAAATQQKSE
jgi:hypothetical protein